MSRNLRVKCPVDGCQQTVKSYRSLARHTEPAHGLCADCAIQNRKDCRCHEERMAEQADLGIYVRISLTDGRRLTVEELKGDTTEDQFVTGHGVNPDCSTTWTIHIISTKAIAKVQPLAYNLISGLLEQELKPRKTRPAGRDTKQVDAEKEGPG